MNAEVSGRASDSSQVLLAITICIVIGLVAFSYRVKSVLNSRVPGAAVSVTDLSFPQPQLALGTEWDFSASFRNLTDEVQEIDELHWEIGCSASGAVVLPTPIILEPLSSLESYSASIQSPLGLKEPKGVSIRIIPISVVEKRSIQLGPGVIEAIVPIQIVTNPSAMRLAIQEDPKWSRKDEVSIGRLSLHQAAKNVVVTGVEHVGLELSALILEDRQSIRVTAKLTEEFEPGLEELHYAIDVTTDTEKRLKVPMIVQLPRASSFRLLPPVLNLTIPSLETDDQLFWDFKISTRAHFAVRTVSLSNNENGPSSLRVNKTEQGCTVILDRSEIPKVTQVRSIQLSVNDELLSIPITGLYRD